MRRMSASVPKFGSFKPKAPLKRAIEETPSQDHDQDSLHVKQHRSRERSNHRQHRSGAHHHHREKSHATYAETPLPPAIVDDFEESPLFIVDRRGDSKNVEFGSMHRYSIPSHHRIGYGRLLGGANRIKIDRDESTETTVVLRDDDRRQRQRPERMLIERRPVASEKGIRVVLGTSSDGIMEHETDFIALRSLRKRGCEAKSPGVNEIASDAVDYRSIEGQAKTVAQPDDADLEYTSASGNDIANITLEMQIRQENTLLSRRVKEHPQDIDAWLSLIEHQALVLDSGGSASGREHRALADIRLSIYEQALKATATTTLCRERLLLGMLDVGSAIWETSKLTAKWEEVLKASSGSITLWRKYIDFAQTNNVNFTYERCRQVYEQCLAMLHAAGSHGSASEKERVAEAQVYVFLRYTAFTRDAGYDELAYAVWQAVLEFAFFRPIELESRAAGIMSFEEFWDGDSPRIGEDGALGWSHDAAHGQAATRPATSRPVPEAHDPDRIIAGFAHAETSLMGGLHLPASTDEEADDPFRYVMFADIRTVLQSLSSDLQYSSLVDAFLTYMHLPQPVRDVSTRHEWQIDQFLQANDIDGRLHRPGVLNRLGNTYDLFAGAFDHVLDADNARFIDRVLERLCIAMPQDDALAEYHIAFKLHSFPSEVSKLARRRLKQRPTSLRLYNAYGLAEAKQGRVEKAIEVWGAALKLPQGESGPDDTALLQHSKIWNDVLASQDERAVASLLSLSGMPNEDGLESVEVSPPRRLATTQYLASQFSAACFHHKLRHAALYAHLHLLFVYISTSYSLADVLSVFAQTTTSSAAPIFLELLHQSLADTLTLHLDSKRPYKPALLRSTAQTSLRLFPNNTTFHALLARLNANAFRLDDRVRETLSSVLSTDDKASLVTWATAIDAELRRCEGSVAGSTQNSVHALFARALTTPSSVVKACPTLWVRWFRWELSRGADDYGRAKRAFYDGLRAMPWWKGWLILGMRVFGKEEGGMTREELEKLYDVLEERGARARSMTKEKEKMS